MTPTGNPLPGIAPGDVFEQVCPPPGYKPGRVTVIARLEPSTSDQWWSIRYSPCGSSEPARESSLLDPKLYRRVPPDPLCNWDQRVAALADRPLPWASRSWQRCRAVVEPNETGYHGRCDLRRGHDGEHALERGMDTPRWSTRWTR